MSAWYRPTRAKLSYLSRSKTSFSGAVQSSRRTPLRLSPSNRFPASNPPSNKNYNNPSKRKSNNPKLQLSRPLIILDTLWLPKWRMSWFRTGSSMGRSMASSRLNGASPGWKRLKPFRCAIHIGRKGVITTSIRCLGSIGWVGLRFSEGTVTSAFWESSMRTGSRGCMCPHCHPSRSSGRQS